MRQTDTQPGDVHVPFNWRYADATARAAAVAADFTDGAPEDDPPGDIGKLALQEDDFSLWMLTVVSPTPVWVAIASVGGSVTASGTLTSNSVVLGAGAGVTKVVAGITSDGTSRLQLGVAGGVVGGVELRNATSGTASIVPPTGALGTAVHTLPAGSGTLFSTTTKADVVQAGAFAADAGANDSYAITLAPPITAYVTGVHYRFMANTANTGAATININALGAKTIVKVTGGITTALADNDIRAGQWVDLVYDGTNMQIQSTLGNAPSSGTVTASSSDTFTNKIFDASDTGNVIKVKGYIYLTHPHRADGTNATINTDATLITYGHATFSHSVDQASNWVEYYIQVPEDLDTSVALRARLKFLLGGTDTATHRHVLSSVSVADSAVPTASTLANAINVDTAGDAFGASGDVETSAWTTLTSWAGALTAGQTWRIRLARDGDDGSNDASAVNSTELGLVIEYGISQ